jgi:hypothetical protein
MVDELREMAQIQTGIWAVLAVAVVVFGCLIANRLTRDGSMFGASA